VTRCYYARAISLYGTPQSVRDIATLENLGFDVVDPDGAEHEKAYKLCGMRHFAELVKTCDVVAFRATPGGRIPAGVAHEIGIARDHGINVIELPSSVYSRTMNIDETREYLREVGHR